MPFRFLFALAALMALYTGCLADPVPMTRTLAPEQRELFFINSLAETVGLYQPGSNTLAADAFPVGSMPNDIAWHDEKILVVNSGDNSVAVYDYAGFELISEIYLGSGLNPYSIIVSRQHDKAFVPNFVGESIAVIDLNTLELIASESHASLATPQAGAVYGDYLFITNTAHSDGSSFGEGSLSLFRIHNASLEYLDSIATGPGSNPQSALVHQDRDELHVILTGNQAADDGEVIILDIGGLPDKPVHLQRLAVGGSPSIGSSGQDSSTDTFYLSGTGGVLAYEYDGSGYRVLRSSADPILAPSGEQGFFSGVAADPDGKQLLVTDFQSDSLVLLDAVTYSRIDSIRVSDGPLAPLLVETE